MKKGQVIFTIVTLVLAVILTVLLSQDKSMDNGLPVIKIREIEKLDFGTKKSCSVTITYNQGRDSVTLGAKAKLRGGISVQFNKRSFTMKLDSGVSFCGIEKDKDWIMNAAYIDKTFMRHKLSYDLFRMISPTNVAPQCCYSELYFNDEYMGMYIIMERMDKTRLGLNKKDNSSVIYKGPPLFYKEYQSYVQDTTNYYHQKFPKLEKRDQSRLISEVHDFLFQSNDSVFKEPQNGVGSYFDIDNVIDWHLLLLLTNNSDGIMKNFYLYKRDSLTGFRFAPWDYDHSFGRDGDYEKNMLERVLNVNRCILIKRLMETNAMSYRKRIVTKWNKLRDSGVVSVESFDRMIMSNHEQIKGKIRKNFKRWPVNSKNYDDANSYEQEIEILKEFIRLRIPQLDNYFAKLESH